MSAKKKTAARKAPKKIKSFEETLWDTANKLRGSVESSDWSGATETTRQGCPEGKRGGANQYKHVVLSLIFLKFVSDKFEERRAELIAEGKDDYLDMVEWSGATWTTRQGCPEGERGGVHQFYTMQNVFYLPETSRWSYIQQHAKQGDIAIKIDSALTDVEASNASLKVALPDNYFSRLGLDGSKLSALIDAINNIDTVEDKEEDTVGRVYEPSGARQITRQGSPEGERGSANQYFPIFGGSLPASRPCGVRFAKKKCAPALGIVQFIKFVESHHGSKKDISVYGQDKWECGDHLRRAKRARRVRPRRKRPNQFTATTYKLAKMNLAVRGLSANLGEVPADTFFKDQHPDLKADYIMANPPFNLKDWRGPDELVHDGRWNGYDTPPTGNANYAWILHMVSKLFDWSGATKTTRQGCPEGERGGANQNGVAGFVLANGSMSTNTKGEGEIRQKLVENDLVDCMIALPGQLFYTTQIPVCLWFLTKNKKADSERGYRNREGDSLFVDRVKPKPKQGKITIVNARQVFEKGCSNQGLNHLGLLPLAA